MRTRFLVTLIFLQCLQAASAFSQLSNASNNEKVAYLLDMMTNSREKAKNIQYRVEYIDEDDLSELKEAIENATSDKAKSSLENLLHEREGHNVSYNRNKVVLDNTGRIRMDMASGLFDSSGKSIANNVNTTWSWDNSQSIIYLHDKSKPAGSAVLDDKQEPSTLGLRHPWRSCTGVIARGLREAVKQQKSMDAEELPDGTYRVMFKRRDGCKKVAIIDPAKGFSCTLDETYKNGSLFFRHTAEYQELTDGVWFPVAGKETKFSNEGTAIFRSTMKATDIKINDPDFDDGLFHVELPKGTSVFDRVTGLHYIVGDPMSITLRRGVEPSSLNDVAMDTLEGMTEQTNEKYQEVELFVPKVDIALEECGPFVLCLSDGMMLNPRNKPESRESDKLLTELGKGDIAWDGEVIATRGAKVLTVKQESKRPLKLTKAKWTSSYEVPNKVELPYSMLVVTRERMNFLMTIIKIESGGIKVSYRQLNPDELSPYK